MRTLTCQGVIAAATTPATTPADALIKTRVRAVVNDAGGRSDEALAPLTLALCHRRTLRRRIHPEASGSRHGGYRRLWPA
jgi:hypothetical protein